MTMCIRAFVLRHKAGNGPISYIIEKTARNDVGLYFRL